jgi:hypothetical protein
MRNGEIREQNTMAMAVYQDREVIKPETVKSAKEVLWKLGWSDSRQSLPEWDQSTTIATYVDALKDDDRALLEHGSIAWTEAIQEATEHALISILYDMVATGRWNVIAKSLQVSTPRDFVRQTLSDKTNYHRTRAERIEAAIDLTYWLYEGGGIEKLGLAGHLHKDAQTALFLTLPVLARCSQRIRDFVTKKLPKLPQIGWVTLEGMVADGTLRPDKDRTEIAQLYRGMLKARHLLGLAAKPGTSTLDIDKALSESRGTSVEPLTLPAEVVSELDFNQRRELENLGWVQFPGDFAPEKINVRYMAVNYAVCDTCKGALTPTKELDALECLTCGYVQQQWLWNRIWYTQWQENKSMTQWHRSETPEAQDNWDVERLELATFGVDVTIFTTWINEKPTLLEEVQAALDKQEEDIEEREAPPLDVDSGALDPNTGAGIDIPAPEEAAEGEKELREMVVVANTRHTYTELGAALKRFKEKHGKSATLIQCHGQSTVKPGIVNIGSQLIRVQVASYLANKNTYFIMRASIMRTSQKETP